MNPSPQMPDPVPMSDEEVMVASFETNLVNLDALCRAFIVSVAKTGTVVRGPASIRARWTWSLGLDMLAELKEAKHPGADEFQRRVFTPRG